MSAISCVQKIYCSDCGLHPNPGVSCRGMGNMSFKKKNVAFFCGWEYTYTTHSIQSHVSYRPDAAWWRVLQPRRQNLHVCHQTLQAHHQTLEAHLPASSILIERSLRQLAMAAVTWLIEGRRKGTQSDTKVNELRSNCSNESNATIRSVMWGVPKALQAGPTKKAQQQSRDQKAWTRAFCSTSIGFLAALQVSRSAPQPFEYFSHSTLRYTAAVRLTGGYYGEVQCQVQDSRVCAWSLGKNFYHWYYSEKKYMCLNSPVIDVKSL